ncbi:MAG: DUF1822 family protein [Aphanothece sp. CMT-3BRIN-NPC111]|jgi:hypothetical protein|nr:DUF1822 family protein [Aphanothece sp. CMT-3BRIN-NPC111]
MTSLTKSPQTQMLTLPITEADRQKALKFAQQQPTEEKQKQVYSNTLAVLVVHHYLEMLDIASDFKSSYSWNRFTRLVADVADLKITDAKVKKLGHVECRPVKAGEQFADIPPEVWDERIGYIFVQFDYEYRQGTLLGFLPTVCREQIPITQLQPLANFLEFLYQPALN